MPLKLGRLHMSEQRLQSLTCYLARRATWKTMAKTKRHGTWVFLNSTIGAKWRFTTGSPYTPYDEAASLSIPIYNATFGEGVLNYDQLNSERIPSIHGLDIRLDKKFFYKKWNLQLFLDIQNAYAKNTILPDYFSVVRNEAGQPIEDPLNTGFYQAKYLENESGNGTVLPSLGIVVQF